MWDFAFGKMNNGRHSNCVEVIYFYFYFFFLQLGQDDQDSSIFFVTSCMDVYWSCASIGNGCKSEIGL
jgi:hypothetical protein